MNTERRSNVHEIKFFNNCRRRDEEIMSEILIQARNFIYVDIQREINLAYASESKYKKPLIKHLIGHTGGGNFLAALGLLAYTEFAGKLKYNCKKENGESWASENFNRFFDELGIEYNNFRNTHDVYNIFRCGLAHEYYVKKSCTIFMIKGEEKCGIGRLDGRYYFVVERYFEDFKCAFDRLLDH